MLTSLQKAEAVVAGLEESSPQLLAQLAANGRLLSLVQDRVQRFNLELVRQMRGQPPEEDAVVEERLLPMLYEFPSSKNQRPKNCQNRPLTRRTALW